MKNFYQDGPRLTNTYRNDETLQKFLKKFLPAEIQKETTAHLDHLGERAVTDMLQWSQEAEAQPPQHIPSDPGVVALTKSKHPTDGSNFEKVAAEEGIVATAYERKQGAFSRVYQMALLYLYSPSSAIYSCPLAMTDGAARALELYGTPDLKSAPCPIFSRAIQKLLDRRSVDDRTNWRF